VLESSGNRNIAQFLEERKERGLSTHCLDLMGSAIYPGASHYIDSAIGVRIKNIDGYLKSVAMIEHPSLSNDISSAFGHNNRRVIEGNVFSRSTVTLIKRTMGEMGVPGFDLITCRPDGPFRGHTVEKIPVDDENALAAYYAIQLRRYADLLNEDGVMLVQIPQREGLYSRLGGLRELFEDETFSREVFDSDYPGNSKVLLIKRLQTS